MRSQDVLHSAYMPHFRAQMNCVPGMITQFAFVPNMTTAEMREDEAIIAKVDKINKIRAKKSIDLVAKGEEALEPYNEQPENDSPYLEKNVELLFNSSEQEKVALLEYSNVFMLNTNIMTSVSNLIRD